MYLLLNLISTVIDIFIYPDRSAILSWLIAFNVVNLRNRSSPSSPTRSTG